MVRDEVLLDDLLGVQHLLPETLIQNLDGDEKDFLISMKRGKPEWDRLEIKHLDQFPALKWKLINIRKMDPDKHKKPTSTLLFPSRSFQ